LSLMNSRPSWDWGTIAAQPQTGSQAVRVQIPRVIAALRVNKLLG
jgi:hypothetical protein